VTVKPPRSFPAPRRRRRHRPPEQPAAVVLREHLHAIELAGLLHETAQPLMAGSGRQSSACSSGSRAARDVKAKTASTWPRRQDKKYPPSLTDVPLSPLVVLALKSCLFCVYRHGNGAAQSRRTIKLREWCCRSSTCGYITSPLGCSIITTNLNRRYESPLQGLFHYSGMAMEAWFKEGENQCPNVRSWQAV
jgi:hypothetical protein